MKLARAKRRSHNLAAILAMTAMICAPGVVSAELPQAAVSGLVVVAENAEPLASVMVYVYRLGELESQQDDTPMGVKLTRVLTDAAGRFLFEQLPAGQYQLVAHKTGFLPEIVPVTRETATKRQVVELELTRLVPGDLRQGEDYWSLQAKMDSNVLRQIEIDDLAQTSQSAAWALNNVGLFSAGFEAVMGTDDTLSGEEGTVKGGKFGMVTRVGSIDVVLNGDYESVAPTVEGQGPQGSASTIDLRVSRGPDVQLSIKTRSDELSAFGGISGQEFDSTLVNWQQDLGSKSHYNISAHVVAENFSPVAGSLVPFGDSGPSRTVTLAGDLNYAMSDRMVWETGFSVHDRSATNPFVQDGESSFGGLTSRSERIDVYGRSGWRVRPAILLEYGVYSVLQDNELTFSPQGSIVMQLNSIWQIGTQVSGSLNEATANPTLEFLSTHHYDEASSCEQDERFCGKIFFSRTKDDNVLSLGAIQREFGKTLRLYFDDGYFRNLESLYVVPGDRLPELQLAVSRRLSPNVLTRFQSNVASGGGGLFYAADRDLYHNVVRYIITSIDTQFQSTSTGIFLGFQHLQQSLSPLVGGRAELAQLDIDRLQLKVAQGLNAFFDLPADWALQLNMELAKGVPGVRDHEAVSSRVIGSLRVKLK